MSAEAIIFDLSAFELEAQAHADQLLDDAKNQGRHCALVTDLPHREAELQLRERFGDSPHHIFSVVLTGVNYAAQDEHAPYSIVLRTLDLSADDAVVVARSPQSLLAAQRAHLQVSA